MKIIIALISFLYSLSLIAQQNLVLNSGNENYNQCPDGLGQINQLYNVFNPNTNTPDFYHFCYSGINNYANIPLNYYGYQFPKRDSAYAGIFSYSINGTDQREYITYELSDSLTSGNIYKISFYVSKAENVKFAIAKIGAYLHSNVIFQNDFYVITQIPQVQNDSLNIITDEFNWVRIEGEYLAGGGEKFITIGNFYPDSLTDTIAVNNDPISGSNKGSAYYYLDDVSVIEIPDTTDTTIVPIDTTIYDISVFPNPNNGEFTLHYNLNEHETGIFKIYNAIGQIVYQEKLTQNNGSINFDIQLAGGVYVWRVEAGGNRLKKEKMVIQK